MTPARLYIAALEAESLERAFSRDPGFFVVGGSEWGGEALAEAASLRPDALVLDGALPGLDGLAALEKLSRLAAPPRVVFLDRLGMRPRADAALPFPWTEEELLRAAHAAAERPLPLLAGPWQPLREEMAEKLLERLGVKKKLKGRRYLRFAAAALACAPRLGEGLSRGLYPLTARAFATTPGAVERAVRAAVEDTWLHGDLAAIQALFGFSVDADRGKPTNAECLAMLGEHVRRLTQKRLDGEGTSSASRAYGCTNENVNA